MAAETEKPVFEPPEIPRPGLVGASVLCFLLFAAAVMGILLAIYLPVAPKPQAPEIFPNPQLQPAPQIDLKKTLQEQRAELERSGWVDKPAGVAAIPVDKAMRIIAGRGESAFDPIPEEHASQIEKEPVQ